MPKRTLGGSADAMAYEASKPRAKLDMEKPVPASEGSSGQQGNLDVIDDIQALPPEQLAPPPEQVAPTPKQVAPPPKQVTPLPRHLPPLPQPVVDGNDDGEEVLTDDVDSDPETQRIYTRRKGRKLDNGLHDKCVRPRIGREGYICHFCNKLMKGSLTSAIQHALGTTRGSLKNGYAFRVVHAVGIMP
ncbi:hypothetical protein ZWY2020_037713 [Hordeum vulgare]|nr:hypothetical protein ZWY2020_037713 [Hordeum vulgare]